MKKKIFSATITLAILSGMDSSARASGEADQIPISEYAGPFLITSLTFLPIVGGPLGMLNEAVIAAQEPAFMVLNNQRDANKNPLFQNAVAQLKKENPQIKDIDDQQMASIILQIGDQLY